MTFKLNNTQIKPLEGGFADKLVTATGKTAEETRFAQSAQGQDLHFLNIEVVDTAGNKTNIDILVQPDMENITTAVQFRMAQAFYITFDPQFNRWAEKRENQTTQNVMG